MDTQIRRFNTALARPELWADRQKIRVERRFDGRPAMPRAFLFTDDNGEVIPTVYLFRNRLHNSEPVREFAYTRIEYGDLDELLEAGWSCYSDEDLDIPSDDWVPELPY